MASRDHGIHSCEEFVPEGSDYFQLTLRRRRWEKLKIKLSPFKEDPSSDKECEELNSWRTSYPSYHFNNKWWCHEEDDEAEWSRWSLAMKQIKDNYSIVISWYCFVIHLVIFSWCVMHDGLFVLMNVYY